MRTATGAARGLVRGTVERVLVATGVASRSRRGIRDHVVVLAWHNVVAAGEGGRGDASLHLERPAFAAQLDRLRRTHRIVPLAEVLEGSSGTEGGDSRPDPRPRAALTFDDGYRGVLRHAVPELEARGLPATVFVCPGLLDADGFWWDRLAEGAGGLGAEVRERALTELQGRRDRVEAALPVGPVPPDYRPVDRAGLLELAARPGITVASHTWSHPNLTALEPGPLREELERSRRWLAETVPGESLLPDHLTVPYGLWNETVAGAAAEAGYRILYRVEGGPAPPSARRMGGVAVLPRINIPAGVSVRGFELRASGVR